MELEFHQLDRRYERLRVQQPARERRLLASLADAGQQMPIVVVPVGAPYVVVDGHKRVRCLRRLQRDPVAAVVWEMPEPEALIVRHLLHADATDSVFEQGWLLRTPLSRSAVPSVPCRYLLATILVAVTDQSLGTSTSFCSKIALPLASVIRAVRFSHSISS